MPINQLLANYGPWAVLLMVLVEDLGVPVPGETTLISAALLASQGKMPIEWLLPAAWCGAVIGDNIGYVIGRFGGRKLVVRYGARIGISDSRLAGIEWVFDRYGGAIVVVARFFVGLRQLNGVVAGISRMAAPRFVLYNAIGAALWVALWGFGVYWLGKRFIHLMKTAGPFVLFAVIGAAIAALLFWMGWHMYRRGYRR